MSNSKLDKTSESEHESMVITEGIAIQLNKCAPCELKGINTELEDNDDAEEKRF